MTQAHAHPRRSARTKLPSASTLVRAATLLRAVGDPARLRLLHRLAEGEWCVSELAAESKTKLSTLSQQLRLLYAERIVDRRRDGKHIYYRLVDEHVDQLVRMAIDHVSEKR